MIYTIITVLFLSSAVRAAQEADSSAVRAAQEASDSDPVIQKIQDLAVSQGWDVPDDKSIAATPDDDETEYTFDMLIPARDTVKSIETAFNTLCKEEGWTLYECRKRSRQRKEGKTQLNLLFAVPFEKAKEREVHIQEISEEGFMSQPTTVKITCDDPELSQGQDWVVCKNSVPQFVFDWTSPHTDIRTRAISMWARWTSESRTLQKMISADVYWVITKWTTKNCWTIERWNRRYSALYPQTIAYVKRGGDEPKNHDQWYGCAGVDTKLVGVQYYYPIVEEEEFYVLNFPTLAKVDGSKYEELHSTGKKASAKSRGWY